MNTSVLGPYTVTYDVSDAAGNPAVQVSRTVNVVDTTVPVITLLGDNPLDVEFGSIYIDAGATASDNVDGDITSSIVTLNPVNTSVLGPYTVTYDVSDSSGNPATQVTRTVNVVDTTAPEITLVGSDPLDVEFGSTYIDAGATASDNVDGDITANIVTVNPVNTSVLGTYTVTYDVSDSSGNAASQVTRTINVVDTAPPIIFPPSDITVEGNVLDGYSGGIGSATATNATDPSPVITNDAPALFLLGDTTVVWTATDGEGSSASANQIVTVRDTTPPLITAPPDATVVATGPFTLVDLGLTTVTDLVDLSPVFTNDAPAGGFPHGVTVVTWTATDASDNSTSATQTVTVLVPLAGFSVEEAEVALDSEALEDEAEVKGNFLLGLDNDVDVPNQDVVIIFDGLTITIPAGSFTRDDDDEGWIVKDFPDGVGKVEIRDDGRFKVEFKDLDLPLTDLTDPVDFSLQIGSNIGQFLISFDDEGEFEADDDGDIGGGGDEDGDSDDDDGDIGGGGDEDGDSDDDDGDIGGGGDEDGDSDDDDGDIGGGGDEDGDSDDDDGDIGGGGDEDGDSDDDDGDIGGGDIEDGDSDDDDDDAPENVFFGGAEDPGDDPDPL